MVSVGGGVIGRSDSAPLRVPDAVDIGAEHRRDDPERTPHRQEHLRRQLASPRARVTPRPNIYENNFGRFYVDGLHVGQTGTSPHKTNTGFLPTRSNSSARRADAFDELKIYNRTLTTSEIASLARAVDLQLEAVPVGPATVAVRVLDALPEVGCSVLAGVCDAPTAVPACQRNDGHAGASVLGTVSGWRTYREVPGTNRSTSRRDLQGIRVLRTNANRVTNLPEKGPGRTIRSHRLPMDRRRSGSHIRRLVHLRRRNISVPVFGKLSSESVPSLTARIRRDRKD